MSRTMARASETSSKVAPMTITVSGIHNGVASWVGANASRR